MTQETYQDRRKALRIRSDDVIRWKRPGRIEDCKGWAVDRSGCGFGFMTLAITAPQVGDILNVRRLDHGTWTMIDRPVRVVRTASATDADLVTIGCRIE